MKKRLKLFIVIFAFACLLFTCGCNNNTDGLEDETKDEASTNEKKLWDKYGGERAVDWSEVIDKDIVYNTYNLNPSYRELAKKAVNSVNKSLKEYSNYTMTTNENQGIGNRKMNQIQKFDDNPKAIAFFNVKDDSITIVVSQIINLKDDKKQQVFLHELGHSIGLKDLYDNEINGKAIMYGYSPNKYTSTEFSKFDNANIDYLYDKEE